ncbi:DsbA family protein [Nocardia crassostreae]|uniref:DsbA family protein n=1 Tax=Nocardia crassostreae TaxID=53428 RepID=UPI000A5AE535|nr:thioredoxin domain-containing protein [Nocardia crassostreae]
MSKNRSGRTVARAARPRRYFTPFTVGAAVVLIALIAVIAVSFQARHRDKEQAAAAVAPPAVFTADGRLRFGDAPTTVTVTTDFQCPVCREFTATTGPTLTELVRSGAIAVEYDTVAVLDRASTDRYSARASNAGVCFAVADKDAWPDFEQRVFEAQPAEGGPGLTDDRLVEIAAHAGASGSDVADCITSDRYAGFVEAHGRAAIAVGLTHVPVVKVGDQTVENLTPDGLRAAVARAQEQR